MSLNMTQQEGRKKLDLQTEAPMALIQQRVPRPTSMQEGSKAETGKAGGEGGGVCSGPAQAAAMDLHPVVHLVSHGLRCSIITRSREGRQLSPAGPQRRLRPGPPGAGLARNPAPLLQAHDSIMSAESGSTSVVPHVAI